MYLNIKYHIYKMNLGKHIIVDMFAVNVVKMSNINSSEDKKEEWNNFIKQCFNDANINLLNTTWNDFDNKGAFTALYLLAESHLSIHTWPEHNFIAIDVFTCGNSNTQLVVDKLLEYFEPIQKKIMHLERGVLGKITKPSDYSIEKEKSYLYSFY